MDSLLTDDTKAIILLCGIFGKEHTTHPLTQVEYNALASFLVQEKMRPESLLKISDLNHVAMACKIDQHRLEKLLGRGVQLGFAIEEWQSSGLWIISRSDADYPERYKSHLREKAPALLFGAGDKSLLQGGGLAIVGSRDVDFTGSEFTRTTAKECAQNSLTVVSGAAPGVDQIAMKSALAAGGKAIGIIADNLLKASLERQARYAIAQGQLVLISPYHPQARLTVATAMGRNKLIYAMADYALVVSAEHNKGGTWAGAEEELKRSKPLTVFVRTGENVPSGNIKLLELGAQKWPEKINSDNLPAQLAKLAGQRPEPARPEPTIPESEILGLFDYQPSAAPNSVTQQPEELFIAEPSAQEAAIIEPVIGSTCAPEHSVYAAVLPVLLEHLQQPICANDLSASIDVTNGQLNIWLKKAVADGVVKKHTNPVRYSAKRRD